VSLGRKLARLGRYSLMAFLLLMLAVSAALWYVTTDSFQEMVRRRLVASIERATGGRVELGSFRSIPLRFQVEVRDLTIHGAEGPAELPLLHVDSMSAVVNLSSALGNRISFHSLTLEHPVAHVILYPDGTTNKPSPEQTSGADLTQLLAIAIARLEIRNGELLAQDRRLPLNFVSNDVSARLDYSFLHQRYSGDLQIGRAETQFDGYRPVPWAGQTIFSVDRSGIEINSLIANSQGSKLQTRGNISDLRHPAFKGNYDILINLQQLGAVIRQAQLRSGTVALKGSGEWSGPKFSTNGSFDTRDLAWQDRNANVKNFSAVGKFVASEQRIQLSRVQGTFLQGGFTSEAEIDNWGSHDGRVKAKTDQRGTIKVQTRDFSLGDLLASLGPRFKPWCDLKFSGNLSSSFEAQWRGSIADTQIKGTFGVTPPSRVVSGQLPITANGRLAYSVRPSLLQIDSFSANTLQTQLGASGVLSNSATALKFSFSSNEMREWQPVVAQLLTQKIPAEIHGRASFNGTANGALSNLTLAGRLHLQDFDAPLPQGSSSQVLHIDSLDSDLRLSSHNLSVHDGVVHSAASVLRIDGNLGLMNWQIVPGSPVAMRLDLENADAAEVASQMGEGELDATGRLDSHLNITGTRFKPQGQGSLSWTNGSVHGHSFDSAKSELFIQGNEAGFRNLEVTSGNSRVTGKGSYNLDAKRFQVSLAGDHFDLAKLPSLPRSRIQIGGTVDFSADISGTRTTPDVNAHVHLHDLSFNNEIAGDYWLDAATHGRDLRLTGRSDFKTAELAIQGDVQLAEQWPAKIDFHFARLDVDPFIESYLHSHITGHSSVAGDLLLEGPLRDPSRLTLAGNLTDISAEVQKVKLHNQGPVRFSIANQTVTLDSVHVVGDATDFSASGSVQLTGNRKLDLHAKGNLGLQIVQTYDPDLTGAGTVMMDAALSGTLDKPLVHGKAQIENSSLSDINLPSALSNLNGSLVFSQNQVTIESLTAQTGGGDISFTGHAELAGKQLNFDLLAKADSVRLRYPPGVSSTATANLHWSGSTAGSILSADVTVMKLGVTPGFDFGAYLQKTVQQSSLPQTDPVLNKIRLDLHVVTTPELQMQTNVLRLRGDADLRVRGNAGKPVLIGRADIFEGEAYFNGTKYRLERGGVTFGTPAANNPAGTVPYVDFQATTRVQDYDITLSINGPADRPKLTYRSEPPLPTNDIIGLLAFGGTSEESAQLQQNSQSAFSQQASNAMLAAALNATLNNRAQRLFGNSRIKIDPQGLETETSPIQNGPAVTIEQQVKDNLTLTYTTSVSQTSQQIIRAEYNLSRNVSIVAIRDQNGVISFDVKIRRRKR
jgi:translocation and assembly module TamB